MKDVCVNGCDLQGNKIPQESIDKGYYGEGVTHYSRMVGIDIRGVYDGVLIWSCPDCGVKWPRFSEGRLYDKAMELIERWENDEEQ